MLDNTAKTKVSEGAERQLVKTNMRRRVSASLRSLYLKQLNLLLPVVMAYYGFLTISHYFALPTDIRYLMISASSTAVLVCGALFLAQRTGMLRARYAHLASIPLALLVIINIFLHIFLTQDQVQMTNGLFALMAFGFMSLHPVIFSALMGLTVILYVISLGMVEGPYTTHFAFMMVGALAIGSIAFINRYRVVAKQTRLALENAAKARILSRMHETIRAHALEAEDAARKAEAASEAKSRFLANTSHELRTPLTGILGMVDLLYKTDVDREQKEMLSAVKSSALGLMTVFNDILDFAKLEEGRMAIKEAPFEPSIILKRITSMMQPEAEAKGIAFLAVDNCPPGLWLNGDAIRLGQILFNFCTNAIKYTEKGSVSIGCDVTTDGAKQRLYLWVQDTGVGIAPSMRKTLFERFSQVDDRADRKVGGTGLGLAICKELADLMGGEITVESTVGEGSRFAVAVTLEKTVAPKVEKAEEDNSHAASRPLRLLVAEDNPINQLLLRKLLKKSGWVVNIVQNGKEAVNAALHNPLPFDLILMDIQMPEMDGVTALGEIQEKLPTIPPVIALTANNSEEEIAFYMEAGFDGFVGKPIDEDLLVREMDKVLAAETKRRVAEREKQAS